MAETTPLTELEDLTLLYVIGVFDLAAFERYVAHLLLTEDDAKPSGRNTRDREQMLAADRAQATPAREARRAEADRIRAAVERAREREALPGGLFGTYWHRGIEGREEARRVFAARCREQLALTTKGDRDGD